MTGSVKVEVGKSPGSTSEIVMGVGVGPLEQAASAINSVNISSNLFINPSWVRDDNPHYSWIVHPREFCLLAMQKSGSLVNSSARKLIPMAKKR
jgi:hypothetical protein